ncbi:carboxypeptidase-like regulatory domain-containing protein [Chitinophaga filiformis]|uniref:carboxypeptidase-like regulatory domain-containing protein n=1 Tax=Chitinophaga filiformis TaxID=104663 RepID=UPI001F2B941C|nr:carboxypeptidase-like regulatory domain-containing protein [Chitinophaga filiformis]MCF6405328.1 carboxypeptidase-like regulatory domain-containing protein [Chitinophaga filiformis]
MTSKIMIRLYCLLALYALSSCTKDELHGPPGPPGDTGVYVALKGDIRGKVILYDSLGRALTDHSGVQVIIDSTDISTVTDASGTYSFLQVQAGRYNFSYRKEGYGTYRIVRQLHPGGAQATQLTDADVGRIYDGPPVTFFTDITLGSPNRIEQFAYMEFAAQIRNPTASVLYISNTPDVSSTNFKATIRYTIDGFIGDGNMNYQTAPIDQGVIRADTTLLRAEHLYLFLAFDNIRDIHYIDEEGRTVYPCTGKKLGSFQSSGFYFQYNIFNPRKANDSIYPLLERFRYR